MSELFDIYENVWSSAAKHWTLIKSRNNRADTCACENNDVVWSYLVPKKIKYIFKFYY